jgi:hypothetical protein
LSIVKAKDNKLGWLATAAIHIILLLSIIFSKGCMELQNPPQFTLEEVAILDFSDKGGGSEGSKSSQVQEESSSESSKEEVTQEESPIQTNTGTNNAKQESENISEDPEAKYDLTNPFGGEGTAEEGNGTGEGTGVGTGTGPNTGGGLGDGVGRQVIGNPVPDNAYFWEGFVMVEFIIDRSGNVISTRVLYPHPKTSLTLSNSQKAFVEKDCKNIFKFTPNSSANKKDRVFKRMQYALD